MVTEEKKIFLESAEEGLLLLGKADERLNLIENNFDVQIIPRGNELLFQGRKTEVDKAVYLLQQLLSLVRKGYLVTTPEFEYSIKLVKKGQGIEINELYNNLVLITSRGKQIRPKTLGQNKYLMSMRNNDIVLCIGPAGTGKTYLALAMAISALKEKSVQRLVLTRPAVEAGESLGFLPGDLQEKVDPYLRPIYDGLYDLLGFDTFQKYMEQHIIEVAPLAYMRGRTLDDSFIILDEAQNTTTEQMKMFLTRLGFGSKAVITGDITQVDLPRGKFSGLIQVQHILNNIKGISFCYLTGNDVVRHSLVQKIIEAYEKYKEPDDIH